jgi:hypothetical protein
MSGDILKLDQARIRDLFDLRRRGEGGAAVYEPDPYPAFHRLRETGPVRWMERWIHTTVHALIDSFEADGRAELNVDFDAAIPMLTITGSFGVDVSDALDIRAAISRGTGDPASAPRCCTCAWGRPIGTPPDGLIPTSTTSTDRWSRASFSATGPTSASECTWRGPR